MSYKSESPEKIQALISEKDVNFIDVRSQQERNSDGYIAGSTDIDIRSPDFDQKLNALDKNKIIVFYCRAGNRSATASQKANNAGFKDVYMIEGGITAWKSRKLPIEK
ncbi:rhodanese-like domain-containing protein [Methanimicrococcus blatticola]|uniref:Rhodanese-related sulfurtransferase n=1 Tax=Methanimicrococcus blatticola TaxID=91560 RepID=A0A484F7I4_9EURY|nr:rhodanese-like domain-containing protein [Methanimicrococcus blatticola]MBZ3935464.1 rhodanese-like domain-containing protein [Methanimicrococcus blatticola]MCC2509107.1 rhodanese-like domain-containing protein [Methanimicrococcus blatticola]TDQ69524.1 rhodanese-related sulfurtransferase [Methanimicrococcus blatticola]